MTRNAMSSLRTTVIFATSFEIVSKSSKRGGDVDLVIYDQEIMALIETKSSPLSVYPAGIILSKTDDRVTKRRSD